MECCYNHPERKAYSTCHFCGGHFCIDCLTLGIEYYYCNSSVCQKKLEEENRWKKIICPNCFSILEISRDGLRSSALHCPECDSFIVLVDSRPDKSEDKNYERLLSSSNQGDIAIIESMLNNADVDYYVTGENFSDLEILPGQKVFYVNEIDIELAKDILKDFQLHLFGLSTNNGEGN